MGNAFDMRETVEISGNIGEAIEAHLDEEFGDDVLDFQIYYNDRGEHSVAIALQTGDVVDGGVLLVMPKPASGENMYELSGILEDEGPVSDFCPQRILDLLSPTENKEAMHWRDRCRHRLLREAGQTDSLPPEHEPEGRWDPEESENPIGSYDWRNSLDSEIVAVEPTGLKF